MTIHARLEQVLQIARLYYEKEATQQEIAAQLGISRPQVSRYLKQARDLGIVQIKVIDPEDVCTQLSSQLKDRFGLKDALVVPVASAEPEEIGQEVGKAAASYLEGLLKPQDVIGISWGYTLHYVAKALEGSQVPRGVKVVQLKGGITRASTDFPTGELTLAFARALQGSPYLLPVPTFVEDAQTRDVLVEEPAIQEILELGRKANIAMVSIGYPSANSVLVKAGFFSREAMENMANAGAVGDICSRFFRSDGSLFDEALDRRAIGISLEEMRTKPYSIGVGGGLRRVGAIVGALRGGYVNILVTDEFTAKKVLDQW